MSVSMALSATGGTCAARSPCSSPSSIPGRKCARTSISPGSGAAGASAVRVENPVRVRAGHVSGTVWPDRPEWGEEGARTDSVNVRMVREGYARARRPGGDPRLTAAQNKAKAERLGIWRAPGRR